MLSDSFTVETIGRDHPHDFVPPKPEALQSIMYTSGTTGMPKGALITHRNIMSASIGQLYGNAATEAGDCTLGYLPLSHIYEQVTDASLQTDRKCADACDQTVCRGRWVAGWIRNRLCMRRYDQTHRRYSAPEASRKLHHSIPLYS